MELRKLDIKPMISIEIAEKWIDKERGSLKKAQVGNVIEFRQGLQGIVEKVNENSVIVDLTYMDNYRDLELDQRTVINHKNYTVIKETALQ